MDKETHTRILQDAIDEDNLMFLCEREGYKAGLQRALEIVQQWLLEEEHQESRCAQTGRRLGAVTRYDLLADLRAELEASEGGEG